VDLTEIEEALTGQDITGTQVAVALALLAVGALLYWVLGRVLRRALAPLTPIPLPEALADVVVRFAQVIVFGIFFAWSLGALGAELGWLTVIAVAILGLAALVAKPFLDGLVSSALVVSREALVVGTEIEVDGIVGEVKGIARRSTIIEPTDGRLVYIPNVELLDKTITVLSAGSERRSTIDLTVDADSDLDHVEIVLRESLEAVPSIIRVGGIRARSFSEGVDLAVNFWHGPRLADRGEAVDAAIRRTKVALEANGIGLAPSVSLRFESPLPEADRGSDG
jgi:small-conductance mechanosensitive channel